MPVPADYVCLKSSQVEIPQGDYDDAFFTDSLYNDSTPDLGKLVDLVFDSNSEETLENQMESIIRLIAAGLGKIASINTSFAGGEQDVLSRFSCVVEPEIPLVDYLLRLTKYLDAWKTAKGLACSARALILSLVYLERVYRLHPGARISSKNVHKVLLVSMLIAVKFTEDQPLSNNYWSKVGGIDLKELNRLEGELCNLIGFEFHVSKAELLSSTLRCCMMQARER